MGHRPPRIHRMGTGERKKMGRGGGGSGEAGRRGYEQQGWNVELRASWKLAGLFGLLNLQARERERRPKVKAGGRRAAGGGPALASTNSSERSREVSRSLSLASWKRVEVSARCGTAMHRWGAVLPVGWRARAWAYQTR
jgi:hypothetical protein